MRAADLKPGDVFDYRGVTVTVLRAREPYRDRFGRDMYRYWCRRGDTNAEGWMEFGPGGEVTKPGGDKPELKPGHALVRVCSRRARHKLCRLVGKGCQEWGAWGREGNWLEIPVAAVPAALEITGVKRPGNVTGLHRRYSEL